MPTARTLFSASEVNGYIYAIGGGANWGNSGESTIVLSTVEAYDTGVGIRVTAISPQEGSVIGGEPIAIAGSSFPSDAVVTIGGEPLTDSKVTDTLISGITPPGTAGEQQILITAPSVDFAVGAGTFFYTKPTAIVVTAMTPSNGAQAGGETGRIAGTGFQGGATLKVGGVEATDVIVTPTLITFMIPPSRTGPGTVDVVVTNPDGRMALR